MHMLQIAINLAHARARLRQAERAGDPIAKGVALFLVRYWIHQKTLREQQG